MDNEFEIVNDSIPQPDNEVIPEQPVMEPQEEPVLQYGWETPQDEFVVTEPPKKKKSGCFKKIGAVVLAVAVAFSCSIFGGIVGALGMRALLRDEEMTGKDNTTNVLEGNRENTVIDVQKVDTGKKMTPAEVYAVSVESTVGITTSVTTNYWGYTTTSAASGSGFIYSTDGYIITNYHVIQDSDSISVSFYDGSSMDAQLVGYDESNDIAVLKVDTKDLKPVILGDSDNLNVGDTVMAIGNPLGELTFSLTAGTVSALDREVTFSRGITMNLIQTDCAINSGNSGGALFNLYGEVVGITNAKYSGNSNSGASIDNIGFAIPMNQVREMIDSIIMTGRVVKPYIGVTIADVSQESLGYGLPAGASVQRVEENSPAQKGGLNVNDIVTHINGEEITGASDLKKMVSSSKPGDEMKLTVWRKGETITVTLIVDEQPRVTETAEQESEQQYYIPFPNFPFFGW